MKCSLRLSSNFLCSSVLIIFKTHVEFFFLIIIFFSTEYLCLSCTGKHRIGPKIPNWSHQAWVEQKDCLPQPAGGTLPNAYQKTVSLLYHKSMLLVYCQLVHKDPWDLLYHLFSPKQFWYMGLFLTRYQDSEFLYAEYSCFPISPKSHIVTVWLKEPR